MPCDLVGGDLLALAAAADDDAAIGLPLATARADLGANRRIVDGRLAVRAAIVDLMAEALQRADEVFLQREAGVVGADRDSHR